MKTFLLKFVFLILPLELLYVYLCRHLVPFEVFGNSIPVSLIKVLLTAANIFIGLSLVRMDFVKMDVEYKTWKEQKSRKVE